MVQITELTITYKRTNQIRQYEPEDIFLALKFTLESGDQGTKAIKGIIDHGLEILTDRVDNWSCPNAKEVSRHVTVKDQNGTPHPVPDKYKGEKGKPEEGGIGAQPKTPPSSLIKEKILISPEQAELVKIYGDGAPILHVEKDGRTIYLCPKEHEAAGGPLQCRMEMWDNRESLKTSNSYHFRCRDNNCSHGIRPKKG